MVAKGRLGLATFRFDYGVAKGRLRLGYVFSHDYVHWFDLATFAAPQV